LHQEPCGQLLSPKEPVTFLTYSGALELCIVVTECDLIEKSLDSEQDLAITSFLS
jgi:hypothetical protein